MSLKTVISMAAVTLCAGPVGRVPCSVGGTQPMATSLRMDGAFFRSGPNAVLKCENSQLIP